ncbi:MAG: hypothetical protein Q9160_007744 [Pyrenula sp. 1 TL-2023]
MRNFSISSAARLAILVQLFVFPFISAHPASKSARASDLDHPVLVRAAAASCSTPPQLCSSCGGEDPQKKHYCAKKADGATSACACVPDKQVLTTTVSGKSATGTYQATRFTEFASISGTTTVSKTVTQNGKETEIAIAVAGMSPAQAMMMMMTRLTRPLGAGGAGIIGGVAWWLMTTSGDQAAAESLSESVDTDSEDDDSDEDKCGDSEPNCSDCGGADVAGNCKTGDHAGCINAAWTGDILKDQYGGKISNIPFSSFLGRPGEIDCSTPPLPDGWDPNKIKDLVKQFCTGFDPNKDKKQTFTDDGTGICTSQIIMEFTHGLSGACSKTCEDTFADMISECSNPDTHLFDAGATFKPPCGEFTLSGIMPDYTGVSAETCYTGSNLPKNGLSQSWDPARIDLVIDYVCSQKLDMTAKGSCSLGQTKDGLIAKKTDPLVFAYAHYHGAADGCPETGTQFNNDGKYVHADTFQKDCLRAFRGIIDKCELFWEWMFKTAWA